MEYIDEQVSEKNVGYRFWGKKEEINNLIQKIELMGNPIYKEKQIVQFFEKKDINKNLIENRQENDTENFQVMKLDAIPLDVFSEASDAIDSMLISGQIDFNFSLGVVEEDTLLAVLFIGRDLQSNIFVYQPICLSDGNQVKLYHLLYSYLKKMLLVDEILGECVTFFLAKEDEKEIVKSIFGKCKSKASALDLMIDIKMSDEIIKLVQSFDKKEEAEENLLILKSSMEVFGSGYLAFKMVNSEIL